MPIPVSGPRAVFRRTLPASFTSSLCSPCLYLLAAAALTPQTSSAQFRNWNSASATDWNTAGNWSPADVPNTSAEAARFATAGLVNPAINASVTVSGISVEAGNYTIGGSGGTFTVDPNTTLGTVQFNVTNNASLTINRNLTTTNSAQSITSRIETTPGSTFTFAAGNTWTSNTGIAVQDLSGSAGGTVNLNGAINLGPNFFQAFGPFGTPSGTVNFAPSSLTSSAGARVQHLGGGGRLNLLTAFSTEIQIGNNAFLATNGTALTYLSTNGMTMPATVRQINAGSSGTGNSSYRYGVDIPGTGTATQSGPIILNGNGAGFAGQSYFFSLDARTDDTFIVTGAIQQFGTPAFLTLAKSGPGTLRLEGSAPNTWTVAPFVVEEGTAVLAKTAGVNSIPAGILTTVNSSARLQIGALNQIQDTADLRLNGGTFDSNGFSETIDQLTITQASSIDFGSGASTLIFSQLASGNGILTIQDWSGSLTGGGTDQLRFTSTAGLAAFLPNINFEGYLPGAVLIGNEVVPAGIPEPGTLALLGATGLCLNRRRKRKASAARP